MRSCATSSTTSTSPRSPGSSTRCWSCYSGPSLWAPSTRLTPTPFSRRQAASWEGKSPRRKCSSFSKSIPRTPLPLRMPPCKSAPPSSRTAAAVMMVQPAGNLPVSRRGLTCHDSSVGGDFQGTTLRRHWRSCLSANSSNRGGHIGSDTVLLLCRGLLLRRLRFSDPGSGLGVGEKVRGGVLGRIRFGAE